MDWWLIPASYLLGSISFGLLLVSILEQQDLRQLGSGNAGATNVLRVAGKVPAVATLVADIGKGALPIWLGLRLGVPSVVLAAAALAVVLGHVFPIYHGFRGGKGVATAAGALGIVAPLVLTVSALVFAVILAVTRYVSLSSVLGVSVYPVAMASGIHWGWLPDGSWWLVASSVVIATLIVLKHRDNLRRVRTGEEHRLGEGRRSG